VTVSILDDIARQAGRLANDVQASLRRARVEGERRLLQRQHRAALEELGERAYELVKDGTLPAEPLGAEVARVESALMEIEAKAAELDGLREEEAAGEPADVPSAETRPGGAPEAEDPSRTAFPMVGDTPSGRANGPGPGWDAAERFFRKG
jgi:hypothetical protein